MIKYFSKIKKKDLLPILSLLVIVALLVFLYRNIIGVAYYLKSDEAIYAMVSQKFLEGDFNLAFHPYWNSGFPLATIPFYLLTQSWEKAQLLVSIVSHILLVLVMYLTLRKFSTPLALVTAFFAAFSPSFTKLVSAGGITEPLYMVLFWLAIYFGWQAISFRKISQYALAGLFFGLAYLTRTEIIYTFSIFLVFITLSYFLTTKTLPSINRVTFLSLIGGVLTYLYIPLSRLSKFSTFKFMIFKSTKGILFAIPFAIVVLLSISFKRNKTSLSDGLKKLAPGLVILVGVFLLVNLPYALTISKNLNHLTLSGKYAFIGSGHPFSPEKDRDTTYAQDIWSIDYPNYKSSYYDPGRASATFWKYIENATEATPGKIDANLNYLAHANVFTDFEAALVLIGFIVAILNPKFRKFAFYLFILWLGSFVFVSHFMDVSPRYIAFSFPIFYIAQAFIIVSIAGLLSKIRPEFLPIVIIIFAIWYFDHNFDAKRLTPTTKSATNLEEKEVGDYLKSEGIDIIMARTEGLAFYANAKIIYTPAANPETIIRFAKEWGVEYLFSRATESSWDYMRAIANANFKHPDLELKHKFEDGSLLWKVKLTEEEKLHNFRTTSDINARYPDLNINSQTILKPGN